MDHSKYSSNISNEAAITLGDILESFEYENGTLQNSPQIISQIKGFLSVQSNVKSLVQIQSFCATTNDHDSLSSLNRNLTQLINFASPIPELHQPIKPLIGDIISSHNIKVFYRCLTPDHSSITNPALDLLTAIVSFNSGSLVDEFLDHFDLTLKSLPDLMHPGKSSVRLANQGKSHITIRHHMSMFWTALCYNASPLTRSDLLTNHRKIVSNWFKFINELDNSNLIKKVLDFVDKKILEEPAFRKMTKCKLIGDFTLSKIIDLYAVEDVKDDVHKLLLKLTTDEEHGLVFHDNRTWFANAPTNHLPTSTVGGGSSSGGVPIVIGDKKFKINNKIIYTAITSLHPWSSSLHLKLVIAVLNKIPELSAPYTTHLFQTNGSHDPKLTSFYIGQTLLLTKIIQLSIPHEFILAIKSFIDDNVTINNQTYYNPQLLLEVICPAPLNRSSLTKGLQAKEPLIRHLTTQLIISVLQKFEKVNSLLSLANTTIFNSLKSELFDSISSIKLPDPTVFVGINNECISAEKVNKLLLLNYMKVAELYNDVLGVFVPLQLSSFNSIVGLSDDVSNKAKLEDIDVLLLNSYMKLTSNGKQLKWWNANKGSKYSTFTTFSKLPRDLKFDNTVDSSLVDNVVNVLSRFVDDTLVFEDAVIKSTNIKYNQTWAIVLSLLKVEDSVISHISKLLDETISRSMKTPYKYYDMVTKLVNDGEPRLSLFYVTLCEQATFCDTSVKDKVVEWIKYLSILLFLLGEPVVIMSKILKQYLKTDLTFNLTNFEKTIKIDDFSNTYETIVFSPLNKLKGKLENIVFKSDIDIIAVMSRLETLVNSDLELVKVEELLLDLVSFYGNYIVQHTYDLNDIRLLQEKYWIHFLDFTNDDNVNSKKLFVATLLNEVFSGVWKSTVNSDYKTALISKIEKLYMSNDSVSKKIAIEYCWVLPKAQVTKLLKIVEDVELINALLDHAAKSKFNLENDEIIAFVKKMENKQIGSSKFAKLLGSNVFTTEQIDQLIESATKAQEKSLYFVILENAISHDPSVAQKITTTFSSLYDDITSSLRGFKFLQFLANHDEDLKSRLYHKSIIQIQQMMDAKTFDESLNMYLESIVLYLKDADGIAKVKLLIEKLIESEQVKNDANLIFSPEMTSVIFTLYSQEPQFEIIDTWLYRATLYITKVFAETTELVDEFKKFLLCLTKSLTTIWKHVPKAMLNSQLEVIFSRFWIEDPEVLKYCYWLTQTGSKNLIEYTKLVNILLSNSDNCLRKTVASEDAKFYTALIVASLYQMNLRQSANAQAMIDVIKLYKCTNSPSDLVLKNLLKKFEEEIKESWVQYVSNWDLITEYIPEFVDGNIEIPSFVIETPGMNDALTVNLNKPIIENTVKYFQPLMRAVSMPEIKQNINSYYDDITQLEEFYSLKIIDRSETGNNIVYDVEFLLLLIVNNEDLFKIDGDLVQVNIRALVDTSLLQLVVCGLCHENDEIQQICIKLLGSVYYTIEQDIANLEKRKEKDSKVLEENENTSIMSFKERSAFKVYIGNLLHTLESRKQAELTGSEADAEPIPKLFTIMVSYLVPILANPTHYLYEKAYRYILNGSKFRVYEIPMYNTILVNFIKDEHGSKSFNADNDFYKYLNWFLHSLSKSITCDEDIKIIRRSGVIETLLNLSNSPFLNEQIQDAIIGVFDKLIKLQNGADLLIRSFGLLSFIECKNSLVDNKLSKKVFEKYKTILLQGMVASSCNGADKRAREWCADDFGNVIKRVCL
ncbi:hypothetical protein CANINC_001618 [Pichia inconspicua]|uniref:Nucleolar pre-ribosomal-associated protein 1 C-terminal domain-containing protein n=1 Tax=Pichia inconspicua TaxID=52247 RepID=A0A4T0X3M3_9ASCO|nr:hypothetical protein CANINC_001618 [[Candida] inconspicua]